MHLERDTTMSEVPANEKTGALQFACSHSALAAAASLQAKLARAPLP